MMGVVIHEMGPVIHEMGPVVSEVDAVIHEMGPVLSEVDEVTHEMGPAIHEMAPVMQDSCGPSLATRVFPRPRMNRKIGRSGAFMGMTRRDRPASLTTPSQNHRSQSPDLPVAFSPRAAPGCASGSTREPGTHPRNSGVPESENEQGDGKIGSFYGDDSTGPTREPHNPKPKSPLPISRPPCCLLSAGSPGLRQRFNPRTRDPPSQLGCSRVRE